ncbi:MAG: GNAT family N-acetyltransferase [Anaerolineae bacterium]|nr:GNAT family N-acetyltransferase [Anaerolineae bacterium]
MKEWHLAATLALIEEKMEYDPHFDIAWLRRRTLEDPTCPPDLLLLAEVDERLVGFCFGCIREGKGVIKLFGVGGPYRRQGIGTALFQEIEARFRARGIQEIIVGAHGPNYFDPGVDVFYTETISFLMERGYETDRVSRVDMEVDLLHADLETAESEARLASEGITIRRADPDEVPQVATFALETFSEGWRYEVSEAVHFSPIPLHIALNGDQVIAFAAYDVTGPSRFGPTGTHPDYRHRGIGSVLLKRCLRDIRERGESKAEILWVGPISFYARVVDAHIHKVYWVFHKTLSPTE